jgi:RNase adapter protein RapZ
VQLVLVSGLSGSGKSIALNVLEDDGYYCVDNLPATLLLEVVDFLAEAGHDRVALSVDARSAALPALPEHIARLSSHGVDCRVLYLEATAPALLRRFSETRRRHPLAGSGLSLSEAIERERTLLAGVAALGQRIDTSELQPRVLQNWIRDLLGLGRGALTLLFESFAYRDGIPLDADWVLDSRMLPNPHYDPQLRPYTGCDRPVIDYLAADAAVGRWLDDTRALLERWLPEIVREHRSYVTVAIGCTGGRHRSVYLAERLAEAFRKDWNVLVRHRGLARDGESA